MNFITIKMRRANPDDPESTAYTVVRIGEAEQFGLDFLQAAVGGLIDCVDLVRPDDRDFGADMFFCDEPAPDAPLNYLATALSGRPLVGDVIITGGPDRDGNTQGLSNYQSASLGESCHFAMTRMADRGWSWGYVCQDDRQERLATAESAFMGRYGLTDGITATLAMLIECVDDWRVLERLNIEMSISETQERDHELLSEAIDSLVRDLPDTDSGCPWLYRLDVDGCVLVDGDYEVKLVTTILREELNRQVERLNRAHRDAGGNPEMEYRIDYGSSHLARARVVYGEVNRTLGQLPVVDLWLPYGFVFNLLHGMSKALERSTEDRVGPKLPEGTTCGIHGDSTTNGRCESCDGAIECSHCGRPMRILTHPLHTSVWICDGLQGCGRSRAAVQGGSDA